MSDADYPPGYGGGLDYNVTYGAPKTSKRETKEYEPPNPLEAHNIEAEAAVLGGLMLGNPNAIPMVSEMLTEDDFYEPLHGRIFRAIVKLHGLGKTPTPVLLRPIFEHDPDMKELGGPAYLAMLTGSGAVLIGLPDLAEQVAELSIRRKVGAALSEGLDRMCFPDADGIDEIDDIINSVQTTAYASMTRSTPMRPRTMEQMIGRVLDRSRDITENETDIGVPCRSIPDLDKVLGKLEPGYHVIGARPGMCKTTLAMTAAWGWAANGVPGEYYHAEMTDDQIAMRQAADISHAIGHGVMHDRIKKGQLSDREMQALIEAKAMAASIPLTFVSAKQTDIQRIEAAAMRAALRWKRQGRKLGFIVVDYMQKLKARDDRGRLIDNRFDRVSNVSMVLGRIAERLEIPVIALAQLKRATDERKDARPQLSDLKESGDIEQDADTVSLLWREEIAMLQTKPKAGGDEKAEKALERWTTDYEIVRNKVEVIGAKNRHGKPRTRTVRFYPEYYAIRAADHVESDSAILQTDLFNSEAVPGWA